VNAMDRHLAVQFDPHARPRCARATEDVHRVTKSDQTVRLVPGLGPDPSWILLRRVFLRNQADAHVTIP
jgi:hypothetical protein